MWQSRPPFDLPASILSSGLLYWSESLLLGFYVFAGLMIFRYGTLSKDFGWEYSSKGDNWCVSEVDPNGVAADKLQAGDRIIAINNDEWITRIGTDLNLHLKLDVIPAETAYTVRVERAGAQHEYDLSVPLKRGFSNFSRIIPLLLVSILFWILAMLLGILKPEQRLAQIAFIAAASSAWLMLGGALVSIDQFFQGSERFVYFWMFGLDTIAFGVTYHLFYLFPSGPPPGHVWAWIKRTLYVWGVLQFIPRALFHTQRIATLSCMGRKQKAEGGRRKAEGRRQKAESRRQKAEGRRQKAEDRSPPSAFCLPPSAYLC